MSNQNNSNLNTPSQGNSTNVSRHASIVEMLSTPPLVQPVATGGSSNMTGSNVGAPAINFQNYSMGGVDEQVVEEDDETAAVEAVTLEKTTSQKTSQTITTEHNQQWQYIKLSQLIEPKKLIFIPASASVEESFNTLVKHHLNSIPVETIPGDMNCLTFDYNDLNSYLLLVLNKITIENKQIMDDCQNGKPVPVGEIVKLTPKNPFIKIAEDETLSAVMGILGSGVHRVAITNNEMTKVKGILSQRRLIKYLWDNARKFRNLESLFNYTLQDLKIGVLNSNAKPTSRQSRVISINGEEPLIMGLYKMFMERISSIAVVDNQYNLIGNISVTDVKHVTRTSQYPLLHKTCRHFISIILNSRGLETGKDSFPIFHVYPNSSLARTLAKLVATRSHRLWIVQPPESVQNSNIGASSSSSSQESQSQQQQGGSQTGDNSGPQSHHIPHGHSHSHSHPHSHGPNTNKSPSPLLTAVDDPIAPTIPQSGVAASAAAAATSTPNLFEKEYRTGKLIGVVSLTDIISLFARRQTEFTQVDPQTARRQRGSIV
ncbi:similar to Saccharomyces cerevisiae YGL056C SDS23 One of two S. cerevisiae homologs (Sds23p and Sds24p) of the S. pombe Sds23 protein, which is implicated in APC/cyclosome regulation [Maudiozyma saulgeensis]|uniref:Similar to Saccharomyces cerevisiae YGL056C SDS23 One of two S. cerevisiae homologs (Sds23p and Sds24p) of the S. pombe Sds23 protein, which is implicated in APC/cyclosome regulation n=1 Tax=Maudiozyma saulgeensis TaxID=1789683 RepID=A0A1X7R0A2_9SACH|nr:similar to Saccharomyces cerevisiae YGL056C SDS23 One of two S. cerevisiae homologs (Sds23p and Sds24p) of the S. pombe Sds23 protein, which is implicated in APC/cyclosome regulation [Kazachstania saulgeensis]